MKLELIFNGFNLPLSVGKHEMAEIFHQIEHKENQHLEVEGLVAGL